MRCCNFQQKKKTRSFFCVLLPRSSGARCRLTVNKRRNLIKCKASSADTTQRLIMRCEIKWRKKKFHSPPYQWLFNPFNYVKIIISSWMHVAALQYLHSRPAFPILFSFFPHHLILYSIDVVVFQHIQHLRKFPSFSRLRAMKTLREGRKAKPGGSKNHIMIVLVARIISIASQIFSSFWELLNLHWHCHAMHTRICLMEFQI